MGVKLIFKKFSRTNIWIFSILFIILSVFLFGWPLGIFGGKTEFPYGDDSPAHMGLILFVVKNWPHINWYPDWYAGAMIQRYNPLAYLIWALFSMVTGYPVGATLFLFTFISLSFIALGVYGLVYEITGNRVSAFIAPLPLITSVVFYSPLTLGAAFSRYLAVMFWIPSLWLLIRYIKTGGRGSYFGTIALMACAIATNILIGTFVALTAVLVLLFCSGGWKDRFLQIIKTGLPTVALLAFLILPIVFTKSTAEFVAQREHYSIPVSVEYFFFTSTPAIFVGIVTFLANKIIKKAPAQENSISSGFQNALKVAMLFVFIYGFTDTQTLRFFSTYDAPWYLLIYLSIYDGILLGELLKKISKKTHTEGSPAKGKTVALKALKAKVLLRNKEIIVASLLVGILVLAPMQQASVSFVAPFSESWDYPQFIAEQLLKFDENETNFRFASDSIHIQRWFNFKYDIPQVGGAQGGTSLYPNWLTWFDESVFVREGNYHETNFLLDWYAVKHFVIANKVWYRGGGDYFTRYGLIDKFLDRPDYYRITSNLTVPNQSYWSGPIYQFKYNLATPILSANNFTTLLVIGSEDTYNCVFRSLALSDYDSRFLIPIRGSEFVDDYELSELKEFSIIYISEFNYHDYNKTWTLLRQYVTTGGGLIIETGNSDVPSLPTPSPVNGTSKTDETTWNFTYGNTLADMWTDPIFFSAPAGFSTSSENSVQPWAQPILWSHGSPILVLGEYGNGRVAWTGLNIAYQAVLHRNYMESSLLPELIEWIEDEPKRISDTSVSNCESTLEWEVNHNVSASVEANLKASNEQHVEGTNSLKAGYKLTETEHLDGEWTRYTYTAPEYFDWSDQELISLWIYGDGSGNELKFTILAPDWNNYKQLWFNIDWNGWKRIIIPMNQMEMHGSPELDRVKQIAFLVGKKVHTENGTWRYIYFDDIRVAQQSIDYNTEPPGFNFDRPHPTELTVEVDTRCNGMLFKESYFKDWHAYASDANETEQTLQIYRAGPDFMYVRIPNNLIFPLTIYLKFETGLIETTSYAISISMLFCLIVYRIWFNKIKLLFSLLKKHKIKRSKCED
ncbi:MAG: 6-pyruvoyl-tetrahydropterin synthase-related protein [Promethearchaeota archaeon]